MRKIAKRSGFSVATVSEALKESSKVRLSTRQIIQQIAREEHYNVNPKVQAAMSAIRRYSADRLRGSIALVDIFDRGRSSIHPFHDVILDGVRESAKMLGFVTELFIVNRGNTEDDLRQLNRIFKSRNIDGLIVLPFTDTVDFSALDFSELSAVSMDYCLSKPHLHHVLPDHYSSMYNSLDILRKRGYQKPGLYILKEKDERLKYRWSAAFMTFQQKFSNHSGIPNICICDEISHDEFLEWYHSTNPDLIVGHHDIVCDWLEKEGLNISSDVGFFNLNCLSKTRNCSGLDLNPKQLGIVAIENVVDLINRGEKGVPEYPKAVSVPVFWVEGDTLRSMS